ncbi:hypothetical protein J4H86_01170 [Spiractinospora alimapuensis]|uniref:hypothetical protein n=1 Tax=Spiractinospora alimapuensis TaxID=2820884 RepID=UPI001F159148|nr:hypothetical protein [Spiractinospora alimapuensis]QVQ52499.1 hypothetical protein J4H86_01170 [Spiractinospora alimapuensis]
MNGFGHRTHVDDPGFLPSVTRHPRLGTLRLISLVVFVVPCGLLPVLGFLTVPPEGALVDPFALFLPAMGLGAVGVAAVFPVPALPVDTPPEEAGRTSAEIVHSRTFIRLALCEAPVLFGFVATFVTRESSLLPLATGAVASAVGLLLVAVPRRRVLERIQDQLERDGATSHMWDALLDTRTQTTP